MRIALTTALLAASIGSSGAEPDAPIEIKGIRIGMARSEYVKLPADQQTIGGVKSTTESGEPFDLGWQDSKLERMIFLFRPRDFTALREAVQAKYPGLKCEDSTVQNRLGATFPQTRCTLQQAGATLSLTRMAGDVQTSALTLLSDELIARRAKAVEAKKSDI